MSDQITITLDASPAAIERIGVGLQAMARAMNGAPKEDPGKPETVTRPPVSDEGNDAAPTATGQDGGEAESTTASAPAGGAASDPSRVDHKGVAFDAGYCAEAADPFYGSGKRAGQWKKKRGLDEAEYDEWYAGQLAALAPAGGAEQQQEQQHAPLNTAGAFGGQQQQEAAPTGNGPRFTEAGAFMGWVAEKQTAGALDQATVQAAYTANGLQVTDLFPPTAPETVAENIAKVYATLSAQVGA